MFRSSTNTRWWFQDEISNATLIVFRYFCHTTALQMPSKRKKAMYKCFEIKTL